MKEHKKLYKSGKLWMTATVLAVAAGAMATTTTAHADTVGQAAGQAAGQVANDRGSQIAALQADAKQQQATINDAQSQLATQQGKLTDTQK